MSEARRNPGREETRWPHAPGRSRLATFRLVALLGAALAAASPATAAPLPVPRAAPPATMQPGGRGPARGIESACGTRLEAAREAVAEHTARTLSPPLPTPNSTDVGEIAVLEDDGNFFYNIVGGQTVADLAAIGQSFYRTHGDDYDCLSVFLSSGLTTWLGSPSAIAAAFVLRNDIQGIGIDPFDMGSGMGSPSRLEWMLSMNGLHRFPPDPFADITGDTFSTMDVIAHEFGHRWLSYAFIDSAGTPSDVLLGRAHAHWSFYFDSDASLMEGGNWTNPAPDSFQVDALSERFGNLDLYLMGLRSAGATTPFFTLHDATDYNPPGAYNKTSWATVGTSLDARQHTWTVADLEALNGPRVPDAATAPHNFRMGVILVTARGQAATPADLAELENLRTLFVGYFSTLTKGLGSVDATIDSRAGSVKIEHQPVADQVDLDDPLPIAARITIAQAGIPLAVDPGSPTLHWRPGTVGPFSPLPMSAAGPDSFAATLPAMPGFTGTVQYYLYAASDSAGIEAFDPPAGAAGPHAFQVGPDLEPPVIAHVPVLVQGTAKMPQVLLARITDNAELDSAWVEYGIGGPPSNSAPLTRVGRDSFQVALYPGLANGQHVDYRFVARDGSGNLARHPASPPGAAWTMAVVQDWFLEAENGDDGFVHSANFPTYRDAWQTTQEFSSPPGGTAWKCGSESPLPYPVHLDSNLYSWWVMSLPPGTLLKFDHRFDLEEANSVYAWDGVRVEAQVLSGPWLPLTPQTPYSHVFLNNSGPFPQGSPCWSGSSGGWRSETFDLSSLAPGPARIRFRMLADDFLGFDGWIVDRIHIDFPGDVTAVPLASDAGPWRPWPNPASEALHVRFALPRAGEVEWTLFDLAGRRVAALARESFAAGPAMLEAPLPRGLTPGLYLARLRVPGMAERVDRVAVVR